MVIDTEMAKVKLYKHIRKTEVRAGTRREGTLGLRVWVILPDAKSQMDSAR